MPEMNLATFFFSHAYTNPDKIALWFEREQYSYGELARLVTRLAHAMYARGIRAGDVVAVMLPNGLEFVALMLAAADLGVALAPLNLSLPPVAVTRAMQAVDACHLIVPRDTLKDLAQNKDFSVPPGVLLELDNRGSGVQSLGNLLDGVALDVAPLRLGKLDYPYILTMTSGSTGDPKPIVLSQDTKLHRAWAAIELYQVTDADRTLAATPLYHSLAERLVLIPLLSGGTSVLLSRFSPRLWIDCVAERGVTFTIAVSSQLAQIEGALSEQSERVRDLRCVVSSSARLEPDIKARLINHLRCEFHECYGASEIAIATNLSPAGAIDHIDSVGVAAPGVEVRILDERDRTVEPGIVGEIVCKTPMLFSGYYRQPGRTQEAMWGDFFRTGDLGRLDEEGYLYYLGRSKELIISGGINIYPADVESVVCELPFVAECAAFALPDERLGEIVAVALVAEPEQTVDRRRIRHHCASRLADFQQPRQVFVVSELPRNALGKLTKHVLVSQFASRTEDP